MRKLLEKGSLILKENGVFEFTLDDACRIRSVYIQSHNMRAYTEIYADFLLIDGTHNISVYDKILIPYTIVDAFGGRCGIIEW